MASEVIFECKLAREYALENIAGSLSYLLIKAMPSPSIDFDFLPLNLSIVIDVSASMKGDKIKHAKEASKLVIDLLSPDDMLSIVIFSDAAKSIVPHTRVTDKDSIIKAIDKIGPVSGTRMFYGIEKAIEEMNMDAYRDSVNMMILLTDGETEGETKCIDLVKQEKDRGVIISTFGIGDTYNELLLKAISDITLGKVYHLQAPEQIMGSFETEVNAARATVITGTTLTLSIEKEIKLEDIHRIFPNSTRLEPRTSADLTSYTTNINSLRRNEATYIGVKMMLPAKENGKITEGLITLRYNVPSSGIKDQICQSKFIIKYTSDRSLCTTTNRDVISYFNQLDIENLIGSAINETKAGNVAEATRMLAQAQMLTQKIGNTALTQNISRATVELGERGNLSAEVVKTMRIGSSHTVKLNDDFNNQ
jgi:Ca-activated chloride channel family protein